MDNLTHSLVGLFCAEAAVRLTERKRPLHAWSRSALYAFAIIGNNLPDLDFSYSNISGKTFGYLLQHRGYTHTLPAALGFALVMMGTLAALAKWRRKQLPPADWRLLAGMALLSPLLHLVMDYANNYGVHPFWPLYNGWFYGDSFFILEPSFWLTLVAPLSWSFRSKLIKGGLWLLLVIALAALWVGPFVPAVNAVALTLLTAALLLAARKLEPSARVYLSAAAFAFCAAAFVLGSGRAKAQARRLEVPESKLIDVVATPAPADPFCWSLLVVREQAARYSVTFDRVSTAPAWLEHPCAFDADAQPTAPLSEGKYSVPLLELRSLERERCEAQAFFRWARVPYLGALRADGSRVLGDLRYDRNPGLDFSDLPLPRVQGGCPHYVPAWIPPRADILSD